MYSKYLQNSCNTSISVGETSYNRLITFKRSAYSLAEVFIAIIIVGSIALLLLSMTARNRQHEFNAKLNKAEASISSILEKDFILNTGREAADYQAEPIRRIINNELKVEKDCTNSKMNKNLCWAEDSYGDYSTEKLLLKDNTSVALKDVASDGINNNIVTTFVFLDANGPKGPNELNKDIRSLKISANKDRLNIASNKAWGECLCPNGIACPGNDIDRCPAGNGTCKCLDGSSCTTLADCPAEPDKISGECECSDGTACPAGNAKLCGGTSSGTCKCSNGNSCPGGTIASCANEGGCVCPNGVACPNGDSTKCARTIGSIVGTCKCPDNKPCPKDEVTGKNDMSKCPNIGGCVCSDGTSCPDGKTTASCFRCEKTCSKGYSVSDKDDPYCTCEKNCKIDKCPGNQQLLNENLSSCKCVCKNKDEHIGDTKYEFDEVNCSWSCNALGNNQVWTDESKCEYCTRGNIPNNATWGSGANACKWSCNQGYNRYDNLCCPVDDKLYLFVDEQTYWHHSLKMVIWKLYSVTNDKELKKELSALIKNITIDKGFRPNSDEPVTSCPTENLEDYYGYLETHKNTCASVEQCAEKCAEINNNNIEYPDKRVYGYLISNDGTIVKIYYSKDELNEIINAGSQLSNGNKQLMGVMSVDGCPKTIIGNYVDASPLVLDLLDDGLKFTSVKDGVMFDINADGKVDKVAWTTKQRKFDNAFLVLDKNNNGQVDNGSELFGDQNGAETGFGELAKYDENGDKLITKADSIFNKLRLWVDFNKNARVEQGEWKTLEEAGITELSTEFNVETDANGNVKRDEHGNKVGFVGWFKQRVETVVNGVKTFVEKIKTMIDVFFNFISGK